MATRRLKLSDEAIAVLRGVIRLFKRNPDACRMSTFREHSYIGECGTVGCIAGWSQIIGVARARKISISRAISVVEELRMQDDYPEDYFCDLLNTKGQVPNAVMYTFQWPQDLRDRYRDASTTAEGTAIVIERIERLIAEGR